MQSVIHRKDRTVLRVSGADHFDFLQDLVSNDLAGVSDGAVYAALLSPQGKYLFDFFLISDDGAVLIDVKADRAAALMQRLGMYRLRAKVDLVETKLQVLQVFEARPETTAYADPRHPQMGWRIYRETPESILTGIPEAEPETETQLRIAHVIPETGIELISDESYILEQGFERLNGVDFAKGCYVGQEIVARMKHKTSLRKGLVGVTLSGEVPSGTPITVDGKPVGTIHTNLDGVGLAYLRFDRAKGLMQADGVEVRRIE